MTETHPLHSMVVNLFSTTRKSIDRYHVAVALGAPSQHPNTEHLWGAYLQVADDALDCLTKEGVLQPAYMGIGKSAMTFTIAQPRRQYAQEQLYVHRHLD